MTLLQQLQKSRRRFLLNPKSLILLLIGLVGAPLKSASTLLSPLQIKPSSPTGTFVLASVNGVMQFISIPNPNFSDAEIPSGTINGTNAVFILGHSPVGTSLVLVRNGIVQQASNDFTLAAATITFISSVPQTGDSLQAWYRY